MDTQALSETLVKLGCPLGKSVEMASQLEKRAWQLARVRSESFETALAHLISLMKQGWAARERGF